MASRALLRNGQPNHEKAGGQRLPLIGFSAHMSEPRAPNRLRPQAAAFCSFTKTVYICLSARAGWPAGRALKPPLDVAMTL
jgi:hypothetical protein